MSKKSTCAHKRENRYYSFISMYMNAMM
jgi:hypothetical protein